MIQCHNLRYAEKFYTLYKDIFPQLVGELTMVPWGHHRIIIDKCKTLEKCLFYIRTTIENNLSRYDLESQILANVYERSQNTLDNFSKTLPSIEEGITNQIMKDPYVRIIHTSEAKRNYDYGSWVDFIEAEEIKQKD